MRLTRRLSRFAIAAWAVMPGAATAQIDLTPGFEPGPAPEIAQLEFLLGTWRVRPEFGSGGNRTSTRVVETEFTPILGGTFLQSPLSVTWPDGQVWSTISIWSWDRFRGEYRVVFLDDLWGLLDIYEGRFEDGALKASNRRAETWGPPPGAMARIVVRQTDQGKAFVLEWEGSTDGETWRPSGLRWVYERIP